MPRIGGDDTKSPPAKRQQPGHRAAKAGKLPAPTFQLAPSGGVKNGGGVKKKKKKKKRLGSHLGAGPGVVAQADAPGAVPQLPGPAAAARGTAPALTQQRDASGPAFLPPPGGKKGKGGSLLQQMRQRLQGGRFRWLNEALYTSDGAAALEMMRGQPDLMQQYHEGFREQTKGWPVQPVDQAIRWLRGRPPGWTVADLGCGDAKIAGEVAQSVHSFDLTPTAPGVVACNMADVPLPGGSMDAAIFCLSLMGTDYGAFLAEAARILKPAGWLWIAEVQSRFVDGGGRSVLPTFLEALACLGFQLRRKDTSNSHFLVLELKRQECQERQPGKGGGQPAWPELRACMYKKR